MADEFVAHGGPAAALHGGSACGAERGPSLGTPDEVGDGFGEPRTDDALKTAARTEIERRGYRIVANIGNNDTDLTGGHADRTFKLPDYDGRLS